LKALLIAQLTVLFAVMHFVENFCASHKKVIDLILL